MDITASTAFKVYIQYKLYQNVTKRWLICNIAVYISCLRLQIWNIIYIKGADFNGCNEVVLSVRLNAIIFLFYYFGV